MLGDYATAKAILRGELHDRKPGPDRRAMTLYWSLADVHERAGELAEAEAALKSAVNAAAGPSLKSSAQRRLQRFLKANAGKQDKSNGSSETPEPAPSE